MLMLVTEASKELGVCPAHAWKMIQRGKWPAYQLGTRKGTRIDPDEIRQLSRLVPARNVTRD